MSAEVNIPLVERFEGVSSKDEQDALSSPRLAKYRALVLNVDFRPARFFPLFTVPWTTLMKWEAKNEDRIRSRSNQPPCHYNIEHYPDIFVRSTNSEVQLPAVVRYPYAVKRQGKIAFTVMNVLIRDNFTCQYTGEKLPKSKLTMDHVIPKSRGGKTNWENIVACAQGINFSKGNRTPEEAGLRLIRRPRKPTYKEIEQQARQSLIQFERNRIHPLWIPYLGLSEEEMERIKIAA